MRDIYVYGESTLVVSAISRLLQDRATSDVIHSKPNHLPAHFSVADCFANGHTKKNKKCQSNELVVICASGYSTSLIEQIQHFNSVKPDISIILLIEATHKHFIKKLLNAGVCAILSYKAALDELNKAIKFSELSREYISHDLRQLMQKTKYPSCFNRLSQREIEITYLLANGMDVKTVSNELNISAKTVNTYRYRIFTKLAINKNIDLFHMVNKEASYLLNHCFG